MIHNGLTCLRGTIKAAVTLTIGGASSAPVVLAVTCRGLPCEIIAAITAILITATPAVAPSPFKVRVMRLILQNSAAAMVGAACQMAPSVGTLPWFTKPPRFGRSAGSSGI